MQIPQKFFKVAAFMHHGSLAATGYVVDQTPQLADLPDVPRPGAVDEAPPLGSFRTFQVPIRDIAVLTGLDLEQLTAVDRMPITSSLPTAGVASTWWRIRTPQDLDLDFDLNDKEQTPQPAGPGTGAPPAIGADGRPRTCNAAARVSSSTTAPSARAASWATSGAP